jgi:hypothetical protein
MVRVASFKIYMLVRLKPFEMDPKACVDIYTMYIRSRVEYAVAAWGLALKKTSYNALKSTEKSYSHHFGSNV